MRHIGTSVDDRSIVKLAMNKSESSKVPVIALQMSDGTIITGKQSSLLTATSAALINAIKYLTGIKDKLKLISPSIFEPLQKLKKEVLHNMNYRLNAQDVLTVLSIAATTNPILENLFEILSSLKGVEAHSTVVLGYEDAKVLKSLEINVSQEAILKND